jgi:hypothetical protein
MAYSRLCCMKCDASFKQEARFLDHLTDAHGRADHLKLFLEVNNIEHPTCQCSSECNVMLPWAGWKKGFTSKFARGHNARIDSVYIDPVRRKQFLEKRIEGFRSGRNKIWNDGLTKATSEKVARASKKISDSLRKGYDSGSIVDWRVGDPEKAAQSALKISTTKQAQFASGELTSWNVGLTKETNKSLESASKKISEAYHRREMGNRLSVENVKSRVDVFSKTFEMISDVTEYSTRRVKRMTFKCVKAGHVQTKSLAMLEDSPVCFKCHPKESLGQLQLYDFVRSIAPDAILSDRTMISPKELDVYVPSKRLGIEYDGLYYHSELNISDDHAQNKSLACSTANVRLFSIFEDEWRDKQDIVKAMIKHRLGIFGSRVGARSCTIKELDTQSRRKFMNDNHIDGDAKSTISWGLIHNGEIMAAVSLRHPFHTVHDDVFEVARFCGSSGCSVPGALSRLTSHALTWTKSNGKRALMTYVDRRIGSADGYVASGFKVVRETKPRFWWTDFNERLNRFSVKADSKNGITQEQAAKNAGVVKIWGSSNVVLELS